ncbi:hypothetical protein PIROE2DRAFT_6124 [Piromyces sp. E2]|nr:hypothetical protein PIROE2DRAFT_6124 [Piromyces sp. E2]|eukprot:OUM66598.1 hypothetical protein PIROE2DRAFT_6124 [Piromyces sp. E2]
MTCSFDVEVDSEDEPPYRWVKFDGNIPSNAITLNDRLGNTLALCRGETDNGLYPGYVDETNKECNVAAAQGKVHHLSDFTILTSDSNKLKWIPWKSSSVFSGYKFIEGGYESNNLLYIAKVTLGNGEQYFGKVPLNGNAYYGEDKEYSFSQYFILVENDNEKTERVLNPYYSWVKYDGSIPSNAITMTNDDDNTLVVCRVHDKIFGINLGYVDGHNNRCSVGYNYEEYQLEDYEILTGDKNKLKWIDWDSSKELSGYKFIEGGIDSNGEALYVCKIYRTYGRYYFGKTSASLKQATFSYNGREYSKSSYKILIEEDSVNDVSTTTTTSIPTAISTTLSYTWVEFNGSIPTNAITLDNGNYNTLAVCRGQYKTFGIHTGYVNETTKKCSIGYGGEEYQLEVFEILTGDKNKLRWIEWNSLKILGGYKFIESGIDSNGETLYVCMVSHSNGYDYFGKTSTSLKKANYAVSGKEYITNK